MNRFGADDDVAEAEAAIERLAAAPTDEGLVLRDIATTDEADIERHRQHNKNADYWLARGHRFDHLRREHELRRQKPLSRLPVR